MQLETLYTRDKPGAYERLSEQYTNPSVWCVHVRYAHLALAVSMVRHSGQYDLPSFVTGEYYITDWYEWGALASELRPVNLVIYFAAEKGVAVTRARRILRTLGREPADLSAWAVSTAADWSNQLDQVAL